MACDSVLDPEQSTKLSVLGLQTPVPEKQLYLPGPVNLNCCASLLAPGNRLCCLMSLVTGRD